MKTEDLISLLASRVEAVDPRRPMRRLLTSWAAGVLVSVVLMAALLRVNAGLAGEMLLGMFWVRAVYCASLALIALAALHRLGRPGARLGFVAAALVLPVLAMEVLAALDLLKSPARDRLALIVGHTALVCPWLITLLAAPLFVSLIWSTRGAAPTQLRRAGAAAGLAAGAAGALVYTLHCPELAAPFLAAWYLLGMLIPAAIGACLGPRLLHW